jgi:hypothetical protein
MQAIQRFWARSVLNKVTLLMSFSLVFCCCGWTGRIGSEQRAPAAAPAAPRVEMWESPEHRAAGWRGQREPLRGEGNDADFGLGLVSVLSSMRV